MNDYFSYPFMPLRNSFLPPKPESLDKTDADVLRKKNYLKVLVLNTRNGKEINKNPTSKWNR